MQNQVNTSERSQRVTVHLPMPIGLMHANGSCIGVPWLGVIQLGRKHVAPSTHLCAHVSRFQCEVTNQQAGLTVTSRSSSNPTGIQYSGNKNKQVTLLQEGDSTQVAVGDRILLLATQLDQYLEVADLAQSGNGDAVQQPASKRQRVSLSHCTPSDTTSLSTATGGLTPATMLIPPSSEAGTAVGALGPRGNTAVGAVWSGATTADRPDSLTDSGGAADLATQATAGHTPAKDARAAESQKAADQLTTAESLEAGQALAQDMRVTDQPKPANSLAVHQPKSADSLTAGLALAGNMLATDQVPAAADSLAGSQPTGAESLRAGQVQPADVLMAGSLEAEQADKKGPPVILIMCGVPGSGKSTFCAQLIAKGQASWVRVNQDSVKNGRRGTKQQCLQVAREAVLAGHCCVIDRCHQDVQQRSAFVELATQLNCQAHAVVLGLPVKVCVGRAARRVGHEGGLEGAAAPRIVHMMQREFDKAGPPTRTEGLASIMDCRSDADIRSALQAWCTYGEEGKVPADLFKRTNPLQRAFAAKDDKLKQDRAVPGLGATEQVPRAAKLDVPISKPEATSHQQQQMPEASGRSALEQQGSQPDEGQTPPTSALHPQLPAKRLTPDADPEDAADPHLPAKSLAANPGIRSAEGSVAKGSSQNAFALLMKASKGSAMGQSMGTAGGQLTEGRSHSQIRSAGNQHAKAAGSRPQGGWQDTLQRIAADPERYKDQYPEMQISSDCVVINDAYPKARCHGLVIDRTPGLNGPTDLRAEHLPLLQAMQVAGEAYKQTMQTLHAGKPRPGPFRMGFHSIPSMKQLHMHVISQDFCSAALKHKKHWNSFTTPFFMDVSDVCRRLQEVGILQINVAHAETMLKQELQCHVCQKSLKNMPVLKSHITNCKQLQQ